MTRKQTEKIRALHAATDGVCKYCGDKAEAFAGTKDDTIHVCKKCTGMIIPHVLKCIRYSDKMAKYVASREEKESPARNARDAARLIVATKKQEIKDPEDRITRLEGMIEELLQHITKPK
jgi:deoxycytidylate deaminase